MRTNIYYACLAIMLMTACKKRDVNPSGNLPALIERFSLVDHPGTSFTVRADTMPYIVSNPVNLPHLTSLSDLRISIATVNATKIEIGQPGIDSAFNCRQLLLEKGQNSVDITLRYYQPIKIKLYNHEFVTAYMLHIHKNAMIEPDFRSLSVDMDPHKLTPLAGVITVSSSQPVSLSYIIKGEDGEDFTSQSTGFDKNKSINLFGLYANTENKVTVVITNAQGSEASRDLIVPTGALPSEFPDAADITVTNLDPVKAKTKFILYYPYKTLNTPFNNPGDMARPIVLDNHGKVRWYLTTPFVLDMKPMGNGHFLLYYYNYIFREIDLTGKIYKEFFPPTMCHHDFTLLPNGNLLYAGEDKKMNNTIEDKLYEIDYHTGATVKTINLYDILDPTRPQQPGMVPGDWFHHNSLAYDKSDNSLLVTGRHQSTICKIDYATLKLKWIISDPSYWKEPWSNYLLQRESSDFDYAWGLHSVVLNPSDPSKIIVFDNGNARSYTNPLSAPDSYSRLVEYTVNEKGQSVKQSFEFGKQMGSENYSPALGNVDYLDAANMFICFPLIVKDKNGNAADFTGTPSIRFMEVDRDKNVLLDISIKHQSGTGPRGYRTYRAHPFRFPL